MIESAAQRVLDLLGDPNADIAVAQGTARELLDLVKGPADATRAMNILRRSIGTAFAEKGLLAAMLCGALIEGGADPQPMVEPMLARLRSIVPAVRRFHDACAADIPADAEDRIEQFEKNCKRLAPTVHDSGARAMLEHVFPPSVAMFAASPAARREAQDLVADLDAMAEFNESAHWLHKILRVLHDEPFVAIEPATGIGIVGRMGGISENFQLNVLLMDAFPQRGWFAKRRVSEAAARIARGDGPQQGSEILSGCWNLYTWRAVRPDGSLPDATNWQSNAHWIWNEGTPADIPPFEGYRVILLGPPAYHRTWNAQRDFIRLRADLTIEEQLKPHVVRQWLGRFAAAYRAGA